MAIESKTVKVDAKLKEQADFVLDMIHSLRTPPYQGIHSTISKANALLRAKYPDEEPKAITQRLADAKIIRIGYARGGTGVMLYDASEPMVKKSKSSVSPQTLDALMAKLPSRWQPKRK